jgi:hypothetical protein
VDVAVAVVAVAVVSVTVVTVVVAVDVVSVSVTDVAEETVEVVVMIDTHWTSLARRVDQDAPLAAAKYVRILYLSPGWKVAASIAKVTSISPLPDCEVVCSFWISELSSYRKKVRITTGS